jgi:invasion protein IalB
MEESKSAPKISGKRRLTVLGSVAATVIVVAGSPVVAQDAPANQPQQLSPAPAKPKHVVKSAAARAPSRSGPAQDSAQIAVGQPASGQAAPLPNGASSITERYGDWTVDCHIDNGQKVCLTSQAQGNRQTGQRSFAIELRTPRDGKTEGAILMPFGLKLENGAILKLDDKNLGTGLRFSTCVPEGCLLPVSFPTVATDAMKTAKTLSVAALNLSNNDVVNFNVSLDGFGAAFARVADLGK